MEYYLWQLYHIDEEARRKRAGTSGERAEIDKLAAAHATAEQEVYPLCHLLHPVFLIRSSQGGRFMLDECKCYQQ